MIEDKQMEEFQRLAKPLMKFLSDHYDPHAFITLDTTNAHIFTGEHGFYTPEFIKD